MVKFNTLADNVAGIKKDESFDYPKLFKLKEDDAHVVSGISAGDDFSSNDDYDLE